MKERKALERVACEREARDREAQRQLSDTIELKKYSKIRIEISEDEKESMNRFFKRVKLYKNNRDKSSEDPYRVKSLEELSREKLGVYANVSFYEIFNTGYASIDGIIASLFDKFETIEDQPSFYKIIGYCDEYIYTSDCKKIKKIDNLFEFLEYHYHREHRGYKILDEPIETRKVLGKRKIGSITYLN